MRESYHKKTLHIVEFKGLFQKASYQKNGHLFVKNLKKKCNNSVATDNKFSFKCYLKNRICSVARIAEHI